MLFYIYTYKIVRECLEYEHVLGPFYNNILFTYKKI